MEDEFLKEVLMLLDSASSIAAIKVIREQTGLGLKDAKELSEKLSGLTLSEARTVLEKQSTASEPSGLDEDEVKRIVEAEGKISAIKYVRQQTGLGLKDAKDFVERIVGVQAKSGCASIIIAGLLLGQLLTYM